MVMTHEFCDYQDSLTDEQYAKLYGDDDCDDLLLQQERDEAEMKATYDAILKRQGAIEALEVVYFNIAKMVWNDPSTSTGLWLAQREIKEHLATLTVP